ncbi:MAG: hypothetical protein LC803_09280 [Acidobacteria bacterium]|nr:hypothetical protein [Acidobacteriota bacterium]
MELLGLFWIMLFMGGPIAVGAYVGIKYGPRIALRRREREIETAMRLGVLDAEIQERVARKIQDER